MSGVETRRPRADVAEQCGCGWLFPHRVAPVRGANHEVVEGAHVGLDCPQCGRGHTFYSPEVAVSAGLCEAGGEA